MRSSIFRGLSFEGFWQEETPQDLIQSKISYKLYSYGQLVKIRSSGIDLDEIVNCITSLENFEHNGVFIKGSEDREIIKFIIKGLDNELFNSLSEEIIQDSVLSSSEFRKLEYITYYLNWKADEFSRRKSYNCNDCRKYNFIKDRFCYLEEEEFELPDLTVEEDELGNKVIVEKEPELKDVDGFLDLVNELTVKEPDLSSFEVGLKYFSHLTLDEKPGIRFELCPEAIKVKSEYLAELFEMEARASEYHVLPFPGSQLDQPALIVEAFDAIRMGRNLFHSQKMRDIAKKTK